MYPADAGPVSRWVSVPMVSPNTCISSIVSSVSGNFLL